MKRLILIVTLSGILAAIGCQKCMECRAYDENGELVNQSEYCGTDSELQTHEQDCQDQYAAIGGTCSCQL